MPPPDGLRIFTGMRFTQDSFAINSIRAYSDGEITINEKTITQSVVITPDSIQPWAPRRIEELIPAHINRLLELDPELVIIGTGKVLTFPPPALTVTLQARGIGVEIMAHDAACRTFNVLLAEDRRVVAALMMG
ncbi:MAG: Mth938-like domain-containing protein [Pseudomonadota bacterium]